MIHLLIQNDSRMIQSDSRRFKAELNGIRGNQTESKGIIPELKTTFTRQNTANGAGIRCIAHVFRSGPAGEGTA